MPSRRCLCLGVIVAVLLFAGPGCGSGAAKLYKVSGKVTLDGQPVSEATVQFEPLDPAEGQKPASGRTGKDGTFTLTTNTVGDGAMAGKYKVAIKKVVVDSNDAFAQKPDGDTTDPKRMMELAQQYEARRRQQKGTPKSAASELPEVYGSFEQTPLTAEVPSGPYEFALKKAGGT